MERAGFLLKACQKYKNQSKKAVKEALNIYDSILDVKELPEKIRNYFHAWEAELEEIKSLDHTGQAAMFLKLSRKIPY